MSAPNKRDLKAFSGVKVPSPAPIFKGFASSTWLLQLLLYSMGSVNLWEVVLLLPWECGSPMNAVSVSSRGCVWRWAKSPYSQEIYISPIQDLRLGSDLDALDALGCSVLESSTQNSHGRELTATAGRQRHGSGGILTPKSTCRCQNYSFP